jgi:hypothetical protein
MRYLVVIDHTLGGTGLTWAVREHALEEGDIEVDVIECVSSHGAKGVPPPSRPQLQIDNTSLYICPDPSGCWGTVTGSGLKPNSAWTVQDLVSGVVLKSGTTDTTGRISPTKLDLFCAAPAPPVNATSTTPAGATVTSPNTFPPDGCD